MKPNSGSALACDNHIINKNSAFEPSIHSVPNPCSGGSTTTHVAGDIPTLHFSHLNVRSRLSQLNYKHRGGGLLRAKHGRPFCSNFGASAADAEQCCWPLSADLSEIALIRLDCASAPMAETLKTPLLPMPMPRGIDLSAVPEGHLVYCSSLRLTRHCNVSQVELLGPLQNRNYDLKLS